jgi:hypothetical protein
MANSTDWIKLGATFYGCDFDWPVNKSLVHLFEIWTINSGCGEPDGSAKPAPISPSIFVFFTNDYSTGRVLSSVTICNQSITLMNVEASVDLASSNLTNVRPLSNLTAEHGPFTQYAGNITGAPLYGGAYNGVYWTNITQGDPSVSDRLNAIQQQFASTVYQYMARTPGGLSRADGTTFGLLVKLLLVSFSPHEHSACVNQALCAEKLSLHPGNTIIFHRCTGTNAGNCLNVLEPSFPSVCDTKFPHKESNSALTHMPAMRPFISSPLEWHSWRSWVPRCSWCIVGSAVACDFCMYPARSPLQRL